MQKLYFAIIINLSIQLQEFEDCLHYQTTFWNGDFLLGKHVSSGNLGPKMGFKEIGYGSSKLMGLKPFNK
jgi:hypothetical protein